MYLLRHILFHSATTIINLLPTYSRPLYASTVPLVTASFPSTISSAHHLFCISPLTPVPLFSSSPRPRSYGVIDDFGIVSFVEEEFPQKSLMKTEKRSFVADFYGCDANWPSLSPEGPRHRDGFDSAHSVKKLKHANLF
ncbi:hypothetical protein PIB30_076032 [Stylosanthes scabra]|uniref:Uncharacterized protein n=1 Tax=Stylosanthes scabra TaxID=79078 RepID=A0ABU6ZNR6_9FABA|nr:hypothetical protein [Stylosanthes scabra]